MMKVALVMMNLLTLGSKKSRALTTELKAPLTHVTGLKDIFNENSPIKVKTVLLDMWGVMHDGSQPYEGVLDTVQKLKTKDVRLVILSNSSKRQSHSIRMLKKLGFNPDDFDEIITSGEVSHRMLCGDDRLQCESWSYIKILQNSNQKTVFVYGSGDQDEEYCESAGWKLGPISEADLIIARGTFTINDGSGTVVSKKSEEAEYNRLFEETLNIAAQRKLPMLVCNPDKVRPDEGLPPMPGFIGDQYEIILGGGSKATDLVKRIGKPFKEVYDLALRGEDPSSAVMIGDALETDVTGGNAIGCYTLWVINDGIHSPDVSEKSDYKCGVEEALNDFNVKKRKVQAESTVVSPNLVIPHFRW